MKNDNLKNALVGIAIALVAAFFFPAYFAFILEGPSGLSVMFTTIPFIGIFYSFWIVIPLGAALGALIPKLAYGKRPWLAALQGALYGALSGLVSTFSFSTVVGIGSIDLVFVLTVVSYCALWVGAYAFIRAKGQRLYR